MTHLGVVTGLAAEARCLPSPRPGDSLTTHCSGGDPRRAEDAAQKLVEIGVDGLVSFGLAGGLHPTLPAGAIVIADAVIDAAGQSIATDLEWRNCLVASLARHNPTEGAVAGSNHALETAAAKHALHAASSAVAVDMESHAVARIAARAAVPFVVVRAVADPASRAVPQSALQALDAAGRVRIGRVVGGLLRRPWDVAGMIALAGDTARAFAALKRCGGAVLLCGRDLG